MESTLFSLAHGFAIAFQPDNLWYAFLGCLVVTLVGVLPGIGPLSGISILLPVTFGLDATQAVIMLAGIYYGSQYGGSTTSILMRIPGEASSVMTCIDGNAMAKKGRAGAALCIAAVGSWVAGTFGVIALTVVAPPLATIALKFGPPEYTALLILGLIFLAYMSSSSLVRTLLMACIGLMLGMIGIDNMTGHFRYSFNLTELGDGIGIVPVAVGLFGLVAGPESANNSASTGAFVPMLALGIPTGPIPAVLMGALMVHGVSPGPQLVTDHPDVFWGFVASMYVGNLMLLALNLPLVGLFVTVLRIPYAYLYPLIIMFCIIGVYEVNHSIVDVWIMLIMGVLGYALRKFSFDPAPLVLGLVIAPIFEQSLRQSLIMSNGNYLIFFSRPISAGLLIVCIVLLAMSAMTFILKRKDWRAKLAAAEAGEPSA